MSDFFNKVLIGHLLIFFDFNINLFDILPDAFGWFIIASAFEAVEKVTDSKSAKLIAFIIGVLSLPFMLNSVRQAIEPTMYYEIITITLPVITLIYYYYFFYVCLSIAKLYKIESRARHMKYLFLSMQMITLLTSAILLHIPLDYQKPVATINAIITFIVYVMFFAFLWKMINQTSGPFFDEEI